MRSNECTAPRILLATDAYGLGIDNPDVARVWQWLLPSLMQKLYQRMGRAMRCGEGQAHFTVLHPPWCIGPRGGAIDGVDAADVVNGEPTSDDEQGEGNQTNAGRRQRLAPGLWEITNVPSGSCVRAVGLGFFDDNVYGTSAHIKPQPCCSGCDPECQISTAVHEKLNKKPDQDSLRRPWLTMKLQEWREKKAQETYPDTYLRFFPLLDNA